MKKHFLLIVLTAIAPIALTSCGGDDDETPQPQSEVTLTTPKYQADAAMYNVAPSPGESLPMNIKTIELTESGDYLISCVAGPASGARATRAATVTEYLTGKFTKQAEAVYKLLGVGTVAITINSDGTCLIDVTLESGTHFTVNATKQTPMVANAMTDYLCRTWTIENTRIRGTISGATVAKDFAGTCNINELTDYAISKGAKIAKKPADNTVINNVRFSKTGRYWIDYANGRNDVGTWHWSSSTGALNYSWDAIDMGNALESGAATVSFTGSKCKLTLKASVSGSDIEVVYTMH